MKKIVLVLCCFTLNACALNSGEMNSCLKAHIFAPICIIETMNSKAEREEHAQQSRYESGAAAASKSTPKNIDKPPKTFPNY